MATWEGFCQQPGRNCLYTQIKGRSTYWRKRNQEGLLIRGLHDVKVSKLMLTRPNEVKHPESTYPDGGVENRIHIMRLISSYLGKSSEDQGDIRCKVSRRIY